MPKASTAISGPDAFKLYDTYGFPFDLTEDFAAEQGMTVDRAGFDASMEEQRDRARAARQDTDSMKVQGGPLADFTVKSEFVGYTDLLTEANVMAIVADDASSLICRRRTRRVRSFWIVLRSTRKAAVKSAISGLLRW